MSHQVALFLALTFMLFLSLFLFIYLQRKLIRETISGYLRSNVEKIEKSMGVYRDKATLIFTGRLMLYFVAPVTIWLLFQNLVYLLLSIVLTYKLPYLIQNWRYTRRMQALENELPVCLSMLASGLSGGVSLSVAIQTYTQESTSPLSTELAHLNRLQRLGVDFDEAIEQVAKRVNLPDFDLVVLAMRISKSVGGNLSETLLSLGNSIQQKLIIEGKIKALTSQGVMQAWVMSLLPVLVAAGLTILQPEQMDKLFNTYTGNLVLLGCGIMDYIGFKVIKKVLTIDV
jgi:tight adherence protein B